mgnify:CR=1 FL=1
MMILAIDPGSRAGWAMMRNGERFSGVWDNAPQRQTKARPADPKYYRVFYAYVALQFFCDSYGYPDLIVCEDAAGFMRGKSAVEASHKYRAIIEFFCAKHNIKLVYVQPADIKRFATGKGNADKTEMIAVARDKYGYTGNDDNEADAIIIREWGITYCAMP